LKLRGWEKDSSQPREQEEEDGRWRNMTEKGVLVDAGRIQTAVELSGESARQ
jgi:hypothetical protein